MNRPIRPGDRKIREAVRAHGWAARVQHLRRPWPGEQGHPRGLDQPGTGTGRWGPCRGHRPYPHRRDLPL